MPDLSFPLLPERMSMCSDNGYLVHVLHYKVRMSFRSHQQPFLTIPCSEISLHSPLALHFLYLTAP